MSYPQGARVTDTRTRQPGVVTSGGTGLTRLITWDDGGTEYVSVDYLAVGDGAPAQPPAPDPIPVQAPEEAVTVALEGPVEVGEPVRRPKFTEKQVIDLIRNWHATHGSPPTSKDWERAHDGYPSTSTVKYLFGTWADAVEAAGFQRPVRGQRWSAKPAPDPVEELPAAAAVSVRDVPVDPLDQSVLSGSPLEQLLLAARDLRAAGLEVDVHVTVAVRDAA